MAGDESPLPIWALHADVETVVLVLRVDYLLRFVDGVATLTEATELPIPQQWHAANDPATAELALMVGAAPGTLGLWRGFFHSVLTYARGGIGNGEEHHGHTTGK